MKKEKKKKIRDISFEMDSKNTLHALGWVFLVVVALFICFLLFDFITSVCAFLVKKQSICCDMSVTMFLSFVSAQSLTDVGNAILSFTGFKLVAYLVIPYAYVICFLCFVYMFIYNFIALMSNFIKKKSPFYSINIKILDNSLRSLFYMLTTWVVFEFVYQLIFYDRYFYLRFPLIGFVVALCLVELARCIIKYGNNIENEVKTLKKDKK